MQKDVCSPMNLNNLNSYDEQKSMHQTQFGASKSCKFTKKKSKVHRFQRLNHPGCIDFWDWIIPGASIFGIEPPRVHRFFGIEPPRVHRFLGFNYPGCIDFLVLRLRIEPPQVHPIVYLFWGSHVPRNQNHPMVPGSGFCKGTWANRVAKQQSSVKGNKGMNHQTNLV